MRIFPIRTSARELGPPLASPYNRVRLDVGDGRAMKIERRDFDVVSGAFARAAAWQAESIDGGWTLSPHG